MKKVVRQKPLLNVLVREIKADVVDRKWDTQGSVCMGEVDVLDYVTLGEEREWGREGGIGGREGGREGREDGEGGRVGTEGRREWRGGGGSRGGRVRREN